MSTNCRKANEFVTCTSIDLPNSAVLVIPAKDVYNYLKEHLDYLIDLHKLYVVCLSKKEELDKLTLESKIQSFTERVTKLKQQINKYDK